jgi:hypothetical protein
VGARRPAAPEKTPALTIRFHGNPYTDKTNLAGAKRRIPAAVNGFDG